MNSRPLTYEGADPRDEPVLRPNHFLFGQPGGRLAAQVADDMVFYSRNRWRLNQNLVKLVLRPWREEFLATLNTRRKWREAKDNLKIGQLVLIVGQNDPHSQWHLIREEDVFPCQDGQVRVVRASRSKPESHPPNNTTVPVERRWPARVRDLERRVGHTINRNLLFVSARRYPRVGYRNQYNKEFCEHSEKCPKCFLAGSEFRI